MAADKTAVEAVFARLKAEGRTALTAPEGRMICEAYGIPVPAERLASSADEAGRVAAELGFPVVMKIVSPDILHKTEAGGVVVGVKSEAEAARAYDEIVSGARRYSTEARVEGVQVQQLAPKGTEVIVGAIDDPSFGKLVAFGLGGVLVEVLKDVTF